MSKPPVETYEQTLEQDPSSPIFVELARAYVERGDNDRAIHVCQQGVTHHPNSVAGRVLWGKALINTGKAAEAMRQFDLAVNINRENPHAYNLIGEVLLRKGLYRSALPVLRRAATLQPNDERISAWLDQTKQALAGGPPPAIEANPVFELEPPPPAPPGGPGSEDRVALGDDADPSAPTGTEGLSPFAAAGPDADDQPTVVTGSPFLASAQLLGPQGQSEEGPGGREPNRITVELPGARALAEAPDPFAAVARSAASEDVDAFAGLMSTAGSVAQHEAQAGSPVVLDQAPAVSQPGGGDSAGPPKAVGLLDEIPEEPVASPVVPHIAVQNNPLATEAIAKEYERELRAKLEVNKQKKTFWQAHGLKLAVGAVALVVLGGLGGSFLVTRLKNRGETLDSALGKGLATVNADTKEQYGAAVLSLEHAQQMDEGNPDVVALLGYAHAMLFAEHGGAESDRAAAVEAFGSSRVREARPDLALVVDFLVATDATRNAARQQLLGSTLEKAVVQAQAGRLLLNDKKYDEALTRLKKATELDPRNTRALVSLGDYYLAFEDWDNVLEMLSSAQALSPYHSARVIGHAEARLELGKEVREALADLEGLPKSAEVPPALAGRYALMLGRALSANGKHHEALETLAIGQSHHPHLALEFAMALGQAQRLAGQMALAQKWFEEALKQAPKSESVKEGLGRILLARSREKELLERFHPEKDARKLALLRGMAWFRLGEPKKAKAELALTQTNGRFPAEAAVYLALCDATDEGQIEKAIEVLEKLAGTIRRNKATVQVALARLYMQKGALDKARTQLEEAAKDPQDYEGNALLGELLLKAGVPPEVAMEPLSRAVERNASHAPSRHFLTHTLLAVGKVSEALKQIDAWLQDNPTLDLAWRDASLVFLQAGKLKEAESAMAKVANVDEVELLRTRALILFARADGRGAMAALERANRLNAKDAETFCEIGNAFVRQGNYDTAQRAFEAAVRENPKSVCGRSGIFHAKPTSRGKPAPKEVLAQLITGGLNAWEKGFVQATLARVLLAGNDLKGARAMVDEALQSAPWHPAAWFAAGEVAKKEKNEAKALEAYGKAAELDGSSSQARLGYAEALAKQGGEALPRAVTQYEAVLLIDQNEADLATVKRTLSALKKQLSK